MKKKTFMLVLALTAMLCLTSCGGNSESGKGSADNQSNANQNQVSSQPEPTPDSQDSESKTPFETFEESLDNSGYSYEKTVMAAEMVGAKAGIKYTFDFGKVELYEFEENSDELSDAVSNGGLTLEGFGVFPCEFNGNLAALIEVTENQEALLSLFNSL